MLMSQVQQAFALSAAAAARIRAIAAKDPDVAGLRIAVEGGGCSGFSYDIQAVPGPQTDDLVIERDGARIFVDSVSLPFLEGSELDYVEEVIGAAFKVKNPNAVAACGCGVSFSV
jgi:iron-sulfur cluster assembly accessory protein